MNDNNYKIHNTEWQTLEIALARLKMCCLKKVQLKIVQNKLFKSTILKFKLRPEKARTKIGILSFSDDIIRIFTKLINV